MNRSLRGIGLLAAGFRPVVLTITLMIVAATAAAAQTTYSSPATLIVPPEDIAFAISLSALGVASSNTITAIEGGDLGTILSVSGQADEITYAPSDQFWTMGFDTLTITSVSSLNAEAYTYSKVILEAGSCREVLFVDNFEGAQPIRVVVGDAGMVLFTSAAALNGLLGLEVKTEVGNANAAFVEYPLDGVGTNPKGRPDDGGLDVGIDPNGEPPIAGEILPISIVQAVRPVGGFPIPGLPEPLSFEIQIQYTDLDGYQVRAIAYDEEGGDATDWYSISNQPHKLSLDWWSDEVTKSNPTPEVGMLFRVDERFAGKLAGIGDPLTVDLIRLGAMNLTNPPDQEWYFDDLEIWLGNLVGEREMFFGDQFDGSTTWTASFQGGGLLTNNASAALIGDYGLDVSLQATSHVFLQSEVPAAEDRFTARFLFDPNTLDMGSDDLSLFTAYGEDGPVGNLQLHVRIKKSASAYQVTLGVWDEDGYRSSGWTDLVDGPQTLTVQWWNAAALNATKGRARLWVGNSEAAEILDIKTGTTQIEAIRLGSLGINGTTGSIYLDEFEIWR